MEAIQFLYKLFAFYFQQFVETIAVKCGKKKKIIFLQLKLFYLMRDHLSAFDNPCIVRVFEFICTEFLKWKAEVWGFVPCVQALPWAREAVLVGVQQRILTRLICCNSTCLYSQHFSGPRWDMSFKTISCHLVSHSFPGSCFYRDFSESFPQTELKWSNPTVRQMTTLHPFPA